MILRRWVYYNICGKYLCVETYLSLSSMFWSCSFPQDRGGGREKRLRMGKWTHQKHPKASMPCQI